MSINNPEQSLVRRDILLYLDPAGLPQAVLLEAGQPVEWLPPAPPDQLRIRDIVLGQVASVDRTQGVFVTVDASANGLLPLGEAPAGVRAGQPILVQVRRPVQPGSPAGLSGKGPILTRKIQYPGLFSIYEPDAARMRPRSKAKLLEPARQMALTASEQEILRNLHGVVLARAAAGGPLPRLLYRFTSAVQAALCDWAVPDLGSLQSNSPELLSEADAFLAERWPDLRPRLRLWPESLDLAAAFRLSDLESLTRSRRVFLKNGGNLVLDPTEALLAVDVNSARAKGSSSAELHRQTNLLACAEIARQLRLRNVAGLIVIDFIRQKDERDREELVQTFSRELSRDRGRLTLGGLTRLGLYELIRTFP
jgi:Ribonuclease G/E